jgi:hypothetical protein
VNCITNASTFLLISSTQIRPKACQKCEDYRHAEAGANELLTTIEYNWIKTAAQLAFLKRIAESLDGEYLAMQSRILAELEGKLKKAAVTLSQMSVRQKWTEKHDDKAISARLATLEKLNPLKKALYAFKKTTLEAIVDDLENGRDDTIPHGC